MKKYSILLFLALLLLFTPACTATDPNNLFETATPTGTSAVPDEASTTSPTVSAGTLTAEAGYAYGNKQQSANFADCGDQILFYVYDSEDGFALYYYDKATGKVTPFCNDATCSHGSKQCNSKDICGLEVYNGKVYAQKAGVGAAWGLVELKDGRFDEILGGLYEFWHANGQLYVRTADNSLAVYKNGSSDPTILVDEYLPGWNVVLGRYLYGKGYQGYTRVDLQAENPTVEQIVTTDSYSAITDGKHIYYTYDSNGGDVSYGFYRCNMDGSDPILLTDQAVLPASMNFDEEYVYFRLYAEDFWKDLNAEDYDVGEDHLAPDLYRMSKADPT